MTVYVDDIYIAPRGWCHMTADTREELDAMADRIGLKREWIQHPGTWKEHYDVTRSKRAQAVSSGAVEVNAYDHVVNFMMPRRTP